MLEDAKLIKYAAWVLRIDKDEIEGNLQSGISGLKAAGKTEAQCVKHLVTNFRTELTDLKAFNESLGVFF